MLRNFFLFIFHGFTPWLVGYIGPILGTENPVKKEKNFFFESILYKLGDYGDAVREI